MRRQPVPAPPRNSRSVPLRGKRSIRHSEGELDIGALIAGLPQAIASNPDGEFMLFRVGDAVASRNIHAAIYDSLRLCKEL